MDESIKSGTRVKILDPGHAKYHGKRGYILSVNPEGLVVSLEEGGKAICKSSNVIPLDEKEVRAEGKTYREYLRAQDRKMAALRKERMDAARAARRARRDSGVDISIPEFNKFHNVP